MFNDDWGKLGGEAVKDGVGVGVVGWLCLNPPLLREGLQPLSLLLLGHDGADRPEKLDRGAVLLFLKG